MYFNEAVNSLWLYACSAQVANCLTDLVEKAPSKMCKGCQHGFYPCLVSPIRVRTNTYLPAIEFMRKNHQGIPYQDLFHLCPPPLTGRIIGTPKRTCAIFLPDDLLWNVYDAVMSHSGGSILIHWIVLRGLRTNLFYCLLITERENVMTRAL